MQQPNPNFRTDPKDYSKVEIAKINSNELRGNLFNEFRDASYENLEWESEQIVKSHGIYLEFNRAKTGSQKDWVYMIRVSIPGGGPITAEQWNILDGISDRYTAGPKDAYPQGRPSLRVTTRQNIQLHWVRKKHVVDAIREIAESGFFTINGCGDNTRNVIGCTLSYHSPVFNANRWAQRAGKYFALPSGAYIEVFEADTKYLRKAGLQDREPGVSRFAYGSNQLNRKFKIAFSAVHYDEETKKYIPDNCVELRTNDIGVAPIINGNGKVDKFQVYIGGSQGTQAGKPTFAVLGEPFGVFTEDNLMKGLDAIVRVHQEWGDRQNRHWARLKYVVKVKGVEWFREQIHNLDGKLDFALPISDFEYGSRDLHLGWIKQPDNNDLWCYGAFIENGRIIDGSPNGDLKSMVKHLMNNYQGIELFTMPNQHLLFTNINGSLKEQFEKDMKKFGYGVRKNGNGMARPYSKLRILSGACVGRDTCRLTYTDSEKFEPYLIDELEKKWGDMAESIGITGCEKQCYRPATKTIGWIGSGMNLYQLTLMGTEDAKHQGKPLTDPDTEEQYLHLVPRKDVAAVTDALFEYYIANRSQEEARPGGTGYFFRRVGAKEIIAYLKSNPKTMDLMKKTFKEP
ncbi:MAG: nitrite/sulfite reductase [Thaumarchaeota archaeon]|nr:nitrite/sulfite reductase [Nitrososphaerota archaeon]